MASVHSRKVIEDEMKLVPFAVLVLLTTNSGLAFAHGGGLDSYGCHNDRKNGGYHCHRGQLAGHSFSSKSEMMQASQISTEKSNENKVKPK